MIRIDAANAALAIGLEAFPRPFGSEEEMLVAWLIALPDELNAAHAARIALDAITRSEIGAIVPLRLRELLLEVARDRAVHYLSPTRRRRGKSGALHREQ